MHSNPHTYTQQHTALAPSCCSTLPNAKGLVLCAPIAHARYCFYCFIVYCFLLFVFYSPRFLPCARTRFVWLRVRVGCRNGATRARCAAGQTAACSRVQAAAHGGCCTRAQPVGVASVAVVAGVRAQPRAHPTPKPESTCTPSPLPRTAQPPRGVRERGCVRWLPQRRSRRRWRKKSRQVWWLCVVVVGCWVGVCVHAPVLTHSTNPSTPVHGV